MSTLRTIVIADDHPLFRSALRALLESLFLGVDLVEATDIAGLQRRLIAAGSVDLIILDLTLPDARGLQGLTLIRDRFPEIPIMVVSAVDDRGTIARALGLGASGYVHKSASMEQLEAAVRSAIAGDVPSSIGPSPVGASPPPMALTPAQVRMLSALQAGAPNKQIAFELGVSESTVKTHMSALFRKLGVQNRTQALLKAQDLGLLD